MISRAAAVGLVALVVGGIAGASAIEPLTKTFYYQVSAVNSVGEGARSNEVSFTFVEPLAQFQQFVTDSQAAAYYKKWVAANPADSARWFVFRDGILSRTIPLPPTMTTKYGAGLVDGGVITLSVVAQ